MLKNKKYLVGLVVILAIGGALAFTMLTPQTPPEESSDSITTEADDETPSASTGLSEDVATGAEARQAAFEALNPTFPEKEKFTFTILPDGSSDPEMFPTEAYMWELIKALAPSKEVLDSVVAYTVYYDEDDTTDASVTLYEDTDDTFVFELNFSAANDFKLLVPVLVHEFSHILSLKDDQVTSYTEDPAIDDTCTAYLIDEGCMLDTSYLNAYYNLFWKGNADYQKTDRAESETEEFFSTRQDNYVTDYATTNPIEDFAESFMYFTTKDPISSDTIKGQKVNYFAQYPELVSYKTNVRKTVSSWAN